MSIFHIILLRKGNIADRICRQNYKTHCIFNIFVFENQTVCEIMCRNVEEPDE